MKWFWKTLTGYICTVITPDKDYHIQHRPFRQPLMYSVKPDKTGLRGKSYDIIVYDESGEL